MKKLLILGLIIINLSGCVATAIIAGAGIGGSILYDKRSISTMIDDKHTTQTAQNLINSNPSLKGRSNISVTTFNHITLLVGQAQTPALKQLAYDLASRVPNITRLYNQIEVAGSVSDIQTTNDTWLTSKVKTALITKGSLRDAQIKVVTENNIVYLMGETTPLQGEKVANITRRVPGVTKVVKVFQYLR